MTFRSPLHCCQKLFVLLTHLLIKERLGQTHVTRYNEEKKLTKMQRVLAELDSFVFWGSALFSLSQKQAWESKAVLFLLGLTSFFNM